MRKTDLGRWSLSGAAVMTATGGFLAAWNRTHPLTAAGSALARR